MIRFFFLFLIPLLLNAQEKKIECFGSSEFALFTTILQKRGYDAQVVPLNWELFEKSFKKDKSWLGKLRQKNEQMDIDPSVTKIFFMNIPNHLYRDYHIKKLPKEKLILFMWEPLMHHRKMYNKNLHACFSQVYTWDDDLVDNEHYFKFYYPCLRSMIEEVPAFEDKKLCTMVSGCHKGKDFSTKYRNELYSERRKAVTFFEEKNENGFDLYGRGWDTASHPSYKGAVEDKIATLKQYRFSICYENCQGLNGYITEKIFDAFAAGNVPIYWGANNITDYVPKGCFIDRRDFSTMEELYAFLKNMKKETYEEYLGHIRVFLKSDQAKLFSKETYEQLFFEAMIDGALHKKSRAL